MPRTIRFSLLIGSAKVAANSRTVSLASSGRSKSTLINALVGLPDLLPMDVAPCTSYITVVESAAEARFEVVRGGSPAVISKQDFVALTAGAVADPDIDLLRAAVPLPWPSDPAVLIDTPGLADITKTRSEVTLTYLPQADAIVLVVDAVAGVKDSVLSLVRSHLTSREQRRVILVLNRKDALGSASDVARRLAASQELLHEDLPAAVWVATDAYGALKSNDLGATGITELRNAITQLVRRDRRAILAQRFGRQAQNRVTELESRLLAEEASLSLSLADAEARLSDFRRKMGEASQSNDAAFVKARAVVTAEVAPWLREIPPRVQAVEAALVAEIEAIETLDKLREYVKTDVLGRSLGLEVRRLSEELHAILSSAIEKVSREVLAEHLVAPQPVTVPSYEMLPPVESVLLHVPQLLVEALEIVVLDFLLPGGLIPAIAARLGLGALLNKVKALGFLRGLQPVDMLRQHLRDAVLEALSGAGERIASALHSASDDATSATLTDVRATLDRRVAAIEAGLHDAQSTLAQDRTRVDARKVLLSESRRRLADLAHELPALTT